MSSLLPRSTAATRRSPRTSALTGATFLAFTLGACRADSVTMPAAIADPVCYDVTCTDAARPAMGASIVIDPLDDVVLRIVPTVTDSRARADMATVLGRLREELLAGRHQTARVQLAYAYEWVERAGDRLNGAELAAIRLALVPAAGALNVGTR